MAASADRPSAHTRTAANMIALGLWAALLPLSGLAASSNADEAASDSFVTGASEASATEDAAPFSSGVTARPISGGSASYYAAKFQGRPTASGERFDNNDLTAAHKSLPFGTLVRVINPSNGQSVVVRINDRGPFVAGRVIDVSRAAAEKLGLIARGHAPVELELIED